MLSQREMGALRWIERMTASLTVGAAVLDLGCGGGEPFARHLIDRGFHVTGVDYDAHLIALAQTRFGRERWLRGDMRTIVLDETFHAVLAWNCLSAMSRVEQDRMAGRVAAWLKPDGRLLFTAERVDAGLIGDYRAGSPYHDDLEPTDYSAAIRAHGMIEMAHVARDESCGGVGVWLARRG